MSNMDVWSNQRWSTASTMPSWHHFHSWLGIPIFGSDFWDPHRKQNFDSVFDSKDSGRIFFWNSDVWRVRKLEFQFGIFGIQVISLRKNSVHLIVANLYWLLSMYNDLILIVHKLVAPLQHQTADQHHVISWHHQCGSCHWPANLDRLMPLMCKWQKTREILSKKLSSFLSST